jgi:hypothetical protein
MTAKRMKGMGYFSRTQRLTEPKKAAQILKAAVPALEKIRDEHQSERLRKAAAKIP